MSWRKRRNKLSEIAIVDAASLGLRLPFRECGQQDRSRRPPQNRDRRPKVAWSKFSHLSRARLQPTEPVGPGLVLALRTA